MDTPFPFGLPLPTAFYLTVYVLTLMIHVVFMNYVHAGPATWPWRTCAPAAGRCAKPRRSSRS